MIWQHGSNLECGWCNQRRGLPIERVYWSDLGPVLICPDCVRKTNLHTVHVSAEPRLR